MRDFRGEKVDVRKRQNYPRNSTNFKNSFQGYLIRGNIKKSAKYDFFFSKKGEGFLAVFFDLFAFSDRFRQLNGKKSRFFFRQISRQSCENDFHSSTISVDPLELKLFVKNCHVIQSYRFFFIYAIKHNVEKIFFRVVASVQNRPSIFFLCYVFWRQQKLYSKQTRNIIYIEL